MKLSKQDADLYFDLMWSLQFFVNRKLGLLPKVPSTAVYQNLPQEEKLKVRDALYAQPGLIDEYVQENPDRLSAEKLAMVSQWKDFVKGEFYIERYLKKYTIFIGGDKVYGVLGLYQGFEEMIHKSYLPMYVRAVLLPFKGQVIYDGLLQSYSVFFGGNIKRELKEQYLRAKQREEIITGFEVEKKGKGAEKKVSAARDWQAEIEELVTRAKKLRGGTGQPAIYSPAFSLVKASLDLALAGVTDAEDVDKLYRELQKVSRALRQVENTIYRM
jgi:hypothetical protein